MKYRNRKVILDGIKFDSQNEAAYYLDLIEMKNNGEVINFTLQPSFVLIPSYKKYGRTIRAITYAPDFYVQYADGREAYVDIKGFATEASKLRKKMFDYIYPELTLVWLTKNKAYGDKYGCIDTDKLNDIIKKIKKSINYR